jgi:hypothetical protein
MALQVEKTSKRGGRIISEKEIMPPPPVTSPGSSSPTAASQQQSTSAQLKPEPTITEIMRSPSKVVLLRVSNIVNNLSAKIIKLKLGNCMKYRFTFCFHNLRGDRIVQSVYQLARGRQSRGRSLNPSRGNIFLLSTLSRLVLGPNQSPIKCIPGALSPEAKRLGCEGDHSPRVCQGQEYVDLYIHSPICLHGVVLN